MKISCSRRIQFCAGHRVYGHEGKCKNMHGHNYVAFFKAEAKELDDVGRVIDFSVLKEKIGGWIDEHWDHGFIYWIADNEMHNFFSENSLKQYALQENPTAENMAAYLLEVICPNVLKDTGIQVTEVELWETENCKATAVLEQISFEMGYKTV